MASISTALRHLLSENFPAPTIAALHCTPCPFGRRSTLTLRGDCFRVLKLQAGEKRRGAVRVARSPDCSGKRWPFSSFWLTNQCLSNDLSFHWFELEEAWKFTVFFYGKNENFYLLLQKIFWIFFGSMLQIWISIISSSDWADPQYSMVTQFRENEKGATSENLELVTPRKVARITFWHSQRRFLHLIFFTWLVKSWQFICFVIRFHRGFNR